MTALLGAGCGFLGGFVNNALNERLKSGVNSVEGDLVRLEQFEDDLIDALDSDPGAPERSTQLRKLNVARRRLGTNIRAKVVEGLAYAKCEAELGVLTEAIGKAEDGEMLDGDTEARINASVRALANILKRASKQSRAFSLLRGR